MTTVDEIVKQARRSRLSAINGRKARHNPGQGWSDKPPLYPELNAATNQLYFIPVFPDPKRR